LIEKEKGNKNELVILVTKHMPDGSPWLNNNSFANDDMWSSRMHLRGLKSQVLNIYDKRFAKSGKFICPEADFLVSVVKIGEIKLKLKGDYRLIGTFQMPDQSEAYLYKNYEAWR